MTLIRSFDEPHDSTGGVNLSETIELYVTSPACKFPRYIVHSCHVNPPIDY